MIVVYSTGLDEYSLQYLWIVDFVYDCLELLTKGLRPMHCLISRLCFDVRHLESAAFFPATRPARPDELE